MCGRWTVMSLSWLLLSLEMIAAWGVMIWMWIMLPFVMGVQGKHQFCQSSLLLVLLLHQRHLLGLLLAVLKDQRSPSLTLFLCHLGVPIDHREKLQAQTDLIGHIALPFTRCYLLVPDQIKKRFCPYK